VSPNSNHPHRGTSLGNLKNVPIAFGDDYYDKAVEHYQISTFGNEYWHLKEDFPFNFKIHSGYSMATMNDELYVFGKS